MDARPKLTLQTGDFLTSEASGMRLYGKHNKLTKQPQIKEVTKSRTKKHWWSRREKVEAPSQDESIYAMMRTYAHEGNTPMVVAAPRNSLATPTSRTSTERVRAPSCRGVAGLNDALGTKAILKEQQKLEKARDRRSHPDTFDSLVLGGVWISM